MTDRRRDRIAIGDVSVGDTGPEITSEELSRSDFVKYAGASGDFAPIHTDEQYATGKGYPSVFAHGMFSAGFLSRMVHRWFGRENVESFSTRFVAQVWPEDTVVTRGEITSVDRETGRVEADIRLENQDGETVVEGTASATLPGR